MDLSNFLHRVIELAPKFKILRRNWPKGVTNEPGNNKKQSLSAKSMMLAMFITHDGGGLWVNHCQKVISFCRLQLHSAANAVHRLPQRVMPLSPSSGLILTLSITLILFVVSCTVAAKLQPEESSFYPVRNKHLVSRVLSFFKNIKYRIAVPELYEQTANPPRHSKVIVIGSGFGGAISALRLGEAGIQTTVLERGQRWPIDPWREIHTYEPLRDGRGLWHRTSMRMPIVGRDTVSLPVDYFGGILDITEYPNMEVWRGACVGGGSKVFAGVMIQPRREYFEEIFGDLVSFDEMNDVFYPRVRHKLRLSPIPEDVYNSSPFGKSRVWDQQVSNAGYSIERPDSIFDWSIIRGELNGRFRKSATIGMSNMGNSNGAKFDVTQNYLRDAETTGHVQVYSNQQVKDIQETKSGYLVYIDKLSPKGSVIGRYKIECDHLILAAGSVGTTELLVKAKEKGLIRGLNDEIGKGWGSNGNAVVIRSFSPLRGITQASPCTSIIHDAQGPAATTFEAWYTAGIPINIGIQGTLGVTYDRFNRGHFVYDETQDEVVLMWPPAASRLTEVSCRRMNDKIASSAPRSRPGVAPLAPDVWAGFTGHPLGGVLLGKATDRFGRVKGASRLYVMDGAVINGTCGAANPSLTISALAERNIEIIIKEDF